MTDEHRDYAESVRERFLQVDTATLSDLLHGIGRREQVLANDLRPFSHESMRVGGWAYTIRGQMTPYEGLGDPEKMRAIEGISIASSNSLSMLGKTVENSMEATEIRRGPIDASTFDVPPGLKKVDSPWH